MQERTHENTLQAQCMRYLRVENRITAQHRGQERRPHASKEPLEGKLLSVPKHVPQYCLPRIQTVCKYESDCDQFMYGPQRYCPNEDFVVHEKA